MLAIRPDLPCVLTTGHAAESLQLPRQVKERVEYLEKPYDPSTLASLMH